MKLLDHIPPTGLLPGLNCQGKVEVIERLVGVLASAGNVLDTQGILAEILRREQDDTTAIGGGLALPHARVQGLEHLLIAVATLVQPLDMPTPDDQPVDVLFLILSPDHEPRRMLRVLARLVRLVRRSDLLTKLRQAASPREMAAAIAAAEAASD
jgi:PTS system nitrogen regulatory IIA component